MIDYLRCVGLFMILYVVIFPLYCVVVVVEAVVNFILGRLK
jgi:hypothetical protein